MVPQFGEQCHFVRHSLTYWVAGIAGMSIPPRRGYTAMIIQMRFGSVPTIETIVSKMEVRR